MNSLFKKAFAITLLLPLAGCWDNCSSCKKHDTHHQAEHESAKSVEKAAEHKDAEKPACHEGSCPVEHAEHDHAAHADHKKAGHKADQKHDHAHHEDDKMHDMEK